MTNDIGRHPSNYWFNSEKSKTMPRADIWQDGINTRFSRNNQPPNRGRKKGRPNRSTIYRAVLSCLGTITKEIVQQRLDNRNAQRRARYAAKKQPAIPSTINRSITDC